jgi:hypothetical protein
VKRVKAADAPTAFRRFERRPVAPADPEVGPRLALPIGVAVDLSAVDTLQAALTYHRQRHTCSRNISPTWTHLVTV